MANKTCEGCSGKEGLKCKIHGYNQAVIACDSFTLEFMLSQLKDRETMFGLLDQEKEVKKLIEKVLNDRKGNGIAK